MIDTGHTLLVLAAVSLACAFASYLYVFLRGTVGARWARWIYALSAAALTGASLVLLLMLLGHRYESAYVFGYTSNDLPLVYLISAFWAGPEGSFLFWALVSGWTGVLFAKSAKDLEAPSMLFWCMFQGVLQTMLVWNSPFTPLGSVVADGSGLNPILQDPWMAIHPPILFVGFAVCGVPAALAAGSLLAGKFERWSVLALPWASLAWLCLGAGLVLGGLWAYEVLGWGGYWGWDPVENSSLVPWITGTVLLHGLIIEKRRNTSARPNYIYALLTYVLVLYSTFLTRSGVLGDFSVHSFSDLGISARLAALVLSVAALFVALLAWRIRKVPAPPIVEDESGKELNHYITVWILSGIAFLVLLGTSAPILTRIMNPESPSGVQPHFYNLTTAPLALGMLLLLSLSPVMAWSARGKAREASPKRTNVSFAVVAAILIVVGSLFFFGMARGSLWALGILGATALGVNLYWFIRTTSSLGALAASVYLAHAGIALMFVGIAGSNLGPPDVNLNLDEGQSGRAMGWTVALDRVRAEESGSLRAELQLTPPGGKVQTVSITGKPMPGGQGYAFKPFIQRGALGDMYFAPHDMRPASAGEVTGHQHSPEHEALPNSKQVVPWMVVGEGGGRSAPVASPDGEFTVTLDGISVESRRVDLTIVPRDGQPQKVSMAQGDVRRIGKVDVQFERYGPMEQAGEGGWRASAILNVAPAGGGNPDARKEEPESEESAKDDSVQPGSVSLAVASKPLMGILWLGCVLGGLGSLFAVIRRFRGM